MTILKIQIDPKNLSKLTVEELQKQLNIHWKLYTEFLEYIERNSPIATTLYHDGENLSEDINYQLDVLEHEYWDIKTEIERRFYERILETGKEIEELHKDVLNYISKLKGGE